MNLTFSKKERLKSKKIIEKLFKEGKSLKVFPMVMVYIQTALPVDGVDIQAGVSVSKRNHKKAVTRNRIKRMMREAYRKNKSLIKTNDSSYAFMFIYVGKELVSVSDLENAVQKLIGKFNNKVDLKENHL